MTRRYIIPARGEQTHHRSSNQGSNFGPKQANNASLQQLSNHSIGEPCCQPKRSSLVGIKRSLSDRTTSTDCFQNIQIQPMSDAAIQDCHSSSSSEDDSLDDDTKSESTVDGDESSENECDDASVLTASGLSDDQLQNITEGLLEFSYNEAQEWMSSVLYVAPPDDRLPPRKRVRTSTWPLQPKCGEKSIAEDELMGISSPTGYFHLACPFYVIDPVKYRDCLVCHDFQSVEALLSHLGHCHKKPLYCPICYHTFDTVSSRDYHILDKKCESKGKKKVDGIEVYQRTKLLKRDRVYLGETTRLKRIWKTIFPHSEPASSLYLQNGCGLKISMIRDYWDIYGHTCVLRFLQQEGLIYSGEGHEETQIALARLTLTGLISNVYADYRLAKGVLSHIEI